MDLRKIRQDFPMLQDGAGHKAIAYFDTACQSLRPKAVIDAINQYYLKSSACSGRSMHQLAAEVTRGVDQARSGGGEIPGRGPKRRDRLYPQHHRRDQPGGQFAGPASRATWC